MSTPLTILPGSRASRRSGFACLIEAVTRLRRQRVLRDLAAVSWQPFEEVIAHAFRLRRARVLAWSTRSRDPLFGADIRLVPVGSWLADGRAVATAGISFAATQR